MDNEFGVVSPYQMKRILQLTAKYARENGEPSPDDSQQTEQTIQFRNDSGVIVPRFSCIQATGTVDDNGRNYLTCIQPTTWTGALTGPFFFNSEKDVPIGGFGGIQRGPIFKAISDGSSLPVETRVGPVSGVFTLSKGCTYSVLGADATVTNCIKIIGNDTPIFAVTGGGGIGGSSSATVTIRDPSSTTWSTGSRTVTAFNPTATAIAASTNVILFPVNGKWAALAMCP